MQSSTNGSVAESATRLHTAHIRGLLHRIDYQDTFSAELPPDCAVPLHVIAHALFTTSPGVVRRLMQIRNMLVKPFGLKTGDEELSPLASTPRLSEIPEPEAGNRIGIFTLRHKDNERMLFMEADKHLDFVVALRREMDNGRTMLHLTTCVQFNNRTGHLYFAVIKPFHKWIVTQCMRDGLQRVLDIPS